MQLIAFNKPYGVVCQFSPHGDDPTLKDFIPLPEVYPAGRLDKDSEGLLLLTDNGALQHAIAAPEQKMPKVYWVQVEGEISAAALSALRRGVLLNDGLTRPAQAEAIAAPTLWERHPPIRFRQAIPTSWLQLTIQEGRNRQVRRMTAAIGLPTLRLVRIAIGPWSLGELAPGQWQGLPIPPELQSRLKSGTVAKSRS